jgi:polar amino acid transport system substrate-binding protein
VRHPHGVALLVVALLIGACEDEGGRGLAAVRARGALRWGADQEGGGPYIYPSPDDPSKVIGFEVDLMAALARRLRVRSEHHQAEWTLLPRVLRLGHVDAIANGFELTPAHLSDKIATIPYYVYELRIVVRADDREIRDWSDLAGKRVGVLSGSSAEDFVRAETRANVVNFDGVTQAFHKVMDGGLDATVQDFPAWVYLSPSFPRLRLVGPPAGAGHYVVYLRPGDEALRDALDEGIRALVQSGELRRIYERYGLWNEAQRALGSPELERLSRRGARPASGLAVVRKNAWLLVQSAGMTVILACVAMPLAIVLGLGMALGRLYGPKPTRWVIGGWIEILRGTPLMLQLFAIFYVVPTFGIQIPAFAAAVIGLAVNYSAYEAEIYRAGLLAIPKGQLEAALALGMTQRTALWRISVPQAIRLVVPPVTNDFIALFKDTSVCSVVTVVELTKQYSISSNSNPNAALQLAALTALLYMVMSLPLARLARRLERRRATVLA